MSFLCLLRCRFFDCWFLHYLRFLGCSSFLIGNLGLGDTASLSLLELRGYVNDSRSLQQERSARLKSYKIPIHTSAGAFAVAVFLALGLAVLALVFVAVFFGAAFFAVVALVLVAAFLGAAFVAVGVVVFGLASLASFYVMSAEYSPMWYM